MTSSNKYNEVYELWKKCFEINSDSEILAILLLGSVDYFSHLSDKDIVKNYIDSSSNYLSDYFEYNLESDAANIFSLKLLNNKLSMLNEVLIDYSEVS